MQYKRFENTIVLRIDLGEEIVASVLKVAYEEKITLASVSGIGATDSFTVGLYDVDKQKYTSSDYCGDHEITSLLGNLTLKDGKPYLHLHMSAAGEGGKTVGGHLNRAVISATCEIFITVLDGTVGRKINPATGLNVFDFD